MGNAVGSIKKITLNGFTFNVMGDANLDHKKGKFETGAVVHSGGNTMAKKLRAQNVESVGIQASASEGEVLKELSESLTNYDMSYVNAAGDIFRAVGNIDLEGHDTDKGLATIKMIPESSDGWVPFLA